MPPFPGGGDRLNGMAGWIPYELLGVQSFILLIGLAGALPYSQSQQLKVAPVCLCLLVDGRGSCTPVSVGRLGYF